MGTSRRSALSLVLLVLISGCPGELAFPEQFGEAECQGTEVEVLFQGSCGGSGCHGATDPVQGLDLVSPNVAERLISVNSTAIGCQERQFIVPGDPEASYILAKVRGDFDICGAKMPLSRTLDPRDIDCIRLWVAEVDGVGEDGGSP